MGRYTSVQTFTDQNTKTVSGYKEAPAGEKGEKVANKPHAIEKVDYGTKGSCAGAGSEEFHIYRASRRREMDRIDNMERDYALKEEDRIFAEKRDRNKREADERTQKNAEKRKRKKMKLSSGKKSGDSNKEIADGSEDEAEETEKGVEVIIPATVE